MIQIAERTDKVPQKCGAYNRLTVLAAALLAVLPLVPQAQLAASRQILASVTDSRGRAVVDVGADDFIVQEAGTPRDVLSVRVADYPIVVLLDTALAARADFELMQKAAAHFIERLGRERPVIVGTFGDVPRLLATFDNDRATVMERLNALTPGGIGGSQLLRGAALAARTLRQTGALFSSIVVLSASAGDDSRDDINQALADIVDSHAVLHVVADRVGGSQGHAERTVRQLVDQTRGEFTPIYSPASYQAALDRLADQLSSEMLIEYLVPRGSKPVDARLGIRLPGTRVRGLGVAPR